MWMIIVRRACSRPPSCAARMRTRGLPSSIPQQPGHMRALSPSSPAKTLSPWSNRFAPPQKCGSTKRPASRRWRLTRCAMSAKRSPWSSPKIAISPKTHLKGFVLNTTRCRPWPTRGTRPSRRRPCCMTKPGVMSSCHASLPVATWMRHSPVQLCGYVIGSGFGDTPPCAWKIVAVWLTITPARGS